MKDTTKTIMQPTKTMSERVIRGPTLARNGTIDPDLISKSIVKYFWDKLTEIRQLDSQKADAYNKTYDQLLNKFDDLRIREKNL